MIVQSIESDSRRSRRYTKKVTLSQIYAVLAMFSAEDYLLNYGQAVLGHSGTCIRNMVRTRCELHGV